MNKYFLTAFLSFPVIKITVETDDNDECGFSGDTLGMTARIYRPAKNAMQSGLKGTDRWLLEFSPAEQRNLDPLMGWTGSGDMQSQVRLKFKSKDDAVAYAERYNLDYTVREPHNRGVRIKAYADSFAYKG